MSAALETLKESAATAKHKAKFILATDGETLEAEDLVSGETVVCAYDDLPDHFGIFLPLAGISTVKEIRENAFDIKATGAQGTPVGEHPQQREQVGCELHLVDDDEAGERLECGHLLLEQSPCARVLEVEVVERFGV